MQAPLDARESKESYSALDSRSAQRSQHLNVSPVKAIRNAMAIGRFVSHRSLHLGPVLVNLTADLTGPRVS